MQIVEYDGTYNIISNMQTDLWIPDSKIDEFSLFSFKRNKLNLYIYIQTERDREREREQP